MKILSLLICLAGLAAADTPTLEQAAAEFAAKLPAGAIVTAEKSGDEPPNFAIAGNPEPPDIDPGRRIFEIGSISKVFNGLLLALAVENGRVKLDSTLAELLPLEFADPDVGRITLLQLATHTSGLPRLPDNLAPNPDALDDPYADYTREKLDAFLTRAELDHAPPFPAAYSNLGAGLLGDILARLADKSWEELVREQVAAPLGMNDTAVVLSEDQRKRFAPAYAGAEPDHRWTFQALAGAGALRSTAADLIIFGEALLDPDATPFPDALKAVIARHAEAPALGGDIGLGLVLLSLDGDPEYSHNGGTGGYRSVLQVLPDSRTVRVVLINNSSFEPEVILTALRDDQPSDAPAIELSAEEMEPFAGIYEISPGSRFTVLLHEGALHVRLTGQPFIPVVPIGNDRFRYDVVPAELRFFREKGKVDRLVLHQNGREIPAARLDEPLPEIRFPEPAALAEYTGEYQFAPAMVITITQRDGTLVAQLTGQPPAPVFQTDTDRFEYDVVEAALEFERDEDGKIIALILDQNGRHRAPRR